MIKASVKTTNNAGRIARKIHQRKYQLLDQFGRDHAQAAAEIQKESRQPSAPGSPPNVHSPAPNLETFQHVVDRSKDKVSSGPIFVAGSNVRPALPGAIERGGRVTVRRRTRSGRTVVRVRNIKARPFVVPSAERALVKFERNLRKGLT